MIKYGNRSPELCGEIYRARNPRDCDYGSGEREKFQEESIIPDNIMARARMRKVRPPITRERNIVSPLFHAHVKM